MKRTPQEMLKEINRIKSILLSNKIISSMNVTGDYAEWLTCNVLKLKKEGNSNRSYDATKYSRGVQERYQIKSRCLINDKKSSTLSDIHDDRFDYLIAILFDVDFNVKEAYKVKLSFIKEKLYEHKTTKAKNITISSIRKLAKNAESSENIEILTEQFNRYMQEPMQVD